MSYDFYANVDTAPLAPKLEPEMAPEGSQVDLLSSEENESTNSPELSKESTKEESAESKVDSTPKIELSGQEKKEITAKIMNKIAALKGEDLFELEPDLRFKQPVNGEEKEVTLQELLNDFSGREGWQKKFTELDQERQNHKKELEQITSILGEFSKKSKENPVAGFEYLAEMAGLNPLEIRKQMRTQFVNQYSKFMEMGEQERKLYELDEELNYYKSQKERESQVKSMKQAEMEFQKTLETTKSQYNISDARLSEVVNDLREFKGEDAARDINLILQLSQAYDRQDRVAEVLEKFEKGSSADDNKFAMLESLLAGNSKLTDEDLLETATKLWSKKSISIPSSIKQKVVTPKKVTKSVTSDKQLNNQITKIVGGNTAINFLD